MKYEKNDHTIYHSDAMDVLRKEISDESVDLVFVDPPYNIGKKFSSFHNKWSSDSEYATWAYQ